MKPEKNDSLQGDLTNDNVPRRMFTCVDSLLFCKKFYVALRLSFLRRLGIDLSSLSSASSLIGTAEVRVGCTWKNGVCLILPRSPFEHHRVRIVLRTDPESAFQLCPREHKSYCYFDAFRGWTETLCLIPRWDSLPPIWGVSFVV